MPKIWKISPVFPPLFFIALILLLFSNSVGKGGHSRKYTLNEHHVPLIFDIQTFLLFDMKNKHL